MKVHKTKIIYVPTYLGETINGITEKFPTRFDAIIYARSLYPKEQHKYISFKLDLEVETTETEKPVSKKLSTILNDLQKSKQSKNTLSNNKIKKSKK